MRMPPNYTPEIGMRVRRLLGDEAGRIFVITGIRPQEGGLFGLNGYYEDDESSLLCRDAEKFTTETSGSENTSPSVFSVGQEVIISERVRNPESSNRRHVEACDVASGFVGQECVVRNVRSDGWVHVSWNNDRNSWSLPPQYLDVIKTKNIDFRVAWRFIDRGVQIPSLMDYLWPKIVLPIQNLSREKGDWNSLLVSRAVLRLRRQYPNSYEEAIIKQRVWGSTWTTVWAALIN